MSDLPAQPAPVRAGWTRASWMKDLIRLIRDRNVLAALDFIAKLAAAVTILYGTIHWVAEAPQRRAQAMFFEQQARMLRVQMHGALLQAIHDASVYGGAGAASDRRLALETLSEDGVGMIGIRVQYVHTQELQGIHLANAEFGYSHWDQSNLSYAHLRGADFIHGWLCEATLQQADLTAANLRYADLRAAQLQQADLRGADLRWSNLQYADVQGADLSNALLQHAILTGADLRGANVQGAQGLPRGFAPHQGTPLHRAIVCPYVTGRSTTH